MHVKQYIQEFETFTTEKGVGDRPLARALRTLYGDAPPVFAGQVQRYLVVLRKYHALYGDEDVILARAPGRVDLLGSHTDYQQGTSRPHTRNAPAFNRSCSSASRARARESWKSLRDSPWSSR